MSLNRNQITFAEEFPPFKAYFQKDARGGLRVEDIYIYIYTLDRRLTTDFVLTDRS
jgi:hypothetical protein